MIEYNNQGKEFTPSEGDQVFARLAGNEDGPKYWILTFRGMPVDPKNLPHRRNSDRLKMTSVSELKFKGYVSFLVGGEQRKLREICRPQNV
jgi:hypothetical protein